MLSTYQYQKFPYVQPPEIAEKRPGHYPVVVVGAGSKDIGISGIYSEDTAVSLDMSTAA